MQVRHAAGALAAAALLSLGMAGTASAGGQNPPGSCGVGNFVSSTNESFGQGFGKTAREYEYRNAGNQVIQPHQESLRAVGCTGQP